MLFRYSFRLRCFIGLLASLVPVGLALVFQYIDKLDPCHLCIFQRVSYAFCALVFAVGLIFSPRNWGKYIYAFFAALGSITGLALAGRQIWLQHLPPDKVPSCGASLDFMVQVMPWKEVISRVLAGTGECSVVDWTLLRLSMAQWSAACFAMLLCMAVWLTLPRKVVRV